MLRPQISRNARPRPRAHVGALLSLLALTSACATSRTMPVAAISAAPGKPKPAVTAAAKPAPSAKAAAPVLPDLGTVLASCEALQARAGILLSCHTNYEAGVLTMTAHFEAQVQLLAYREALHERLGMPFCQAAARSGQAARVAMEQHGRGRFVWDCQRAAWSDWQAVAKPNPPAPTAVCQALDRDPVLPVRCRAAAANGTATMTLRFASEELAQPLLASMDQDVASPFCAGSSAAGQAALVHLRYDASKRGRSYNCETRTWGDWYSTEAQHAQAPASATRPSAPAAPRAQSVRGGGSI